MKAIEKSPDQRYNSAEELADDLRAFLDDRPIKAKPPTSVQRAAKWSRRHSTLVRTAMATLSVAIAIGGGLLWNERSRTLAALEQESVQRSRTLSALQRVTEQRDLANSNYQVAAQSIDRLLVRFSHDDLGRIPELEEIRAEVMRDAVELFTQLIEMDSENSDAYLQRGRAYANLALPEHVLSDYYRAVELDSGNHEAHYAS